MAEQWYNTLSSESKLKFLCATMLLGEEEVAVALAENNDIDSLFAGIADKVYGVPVQ